MWTAVVSSPANLAKLDRYQEIARRLAKAEGVSEAEAKALDAGESEAAKVKRNATDDLKVTTARGTVTTDDLPKNMPPLSTPPTAKDDDAGSKRGKRERE